MARRCGHWGDRLDGRECRKPIRDRTARLHTLLGTRDSLPRGLWVVRFEQGTTVQPAVLFPCAGGEVFSFVAAGSLLKLFIRKELGSLAPVPDSSLATRSTGQLRLWAGVIGYLRAWLLLAI